MPKNSNVSNVDLLNQERKRTGLYTPPMGTPNRRTTTSNKAFTTIANGTPIKQKIALEKKQGAKERQASHTQHKASQLKLTASFLAFTVVGTILPAVAASNTEYNTRSRRPLSRRDNEPRLVTTGGYVYPPAVNATDYNGYNGFALQTPSTNPFNPIPTGRSVAAVDLNGDNLADVVTGSNNTVYVRFGNRTSNSPVESTQQLNGNNGFTLVGDNIGKTVQPADDHNGDGVPDVITTNGLYQATAAWLLFGHRSSWQPIVNVTEFNGTNGIKFINTANPYTNHSIGIARGIGDVNGDGLTDIGFAPCATPFLNSEGKTEIGACIKYGHRGYFNPVYDLGTLTGKDGFYVTGIYDNDELVGDITPVGKFFVSNIDSFAISNAGKRVDNKEHAGQIWVISGNRAFPRNLNVTNSLNGNSCFTIKGDNAGDWTGVSLGMTPYGSGQGSERPTPLPSFIFSAPGEGNISYAYMLHGSTHTFPTTMYPSDINGTNGYRVFSREVLIYSVSGSGNFNRDSVTGAVFGTTAAGKRTFFVAGSRANPRPDVNLDTLDGEDGFAIIDNATDASSHFVASASQATGASDANGDGCDDIIHGTTSDSKAVITYGCDRLLSSGSSFFGSHQPKSESTDSNKVIPSTKVIGQAFHH